MTRTATPSNEPEYDKLIAGLKADYDSPFSKVLDESKKTPCIDNHHNKCFCLDDVYHYPDIDTYMGGKIICQFKHDDKDVEIFLGVEENWIIYYNTESKVFHFEKGDKIYKKARSDFDI
jgi:hypothetical protein